MTCPQNRQLDPVQGLVDYTLDIKPYHTKILEVLVEYVYGEAVDVVIEDNHEIIIDLFKPLDPSSLALYSCEGYDERSFSDPMSTMILSPNQTTFAAGGFTYGFNIATNSFSVLGDRTGDFRVGATINIATFVEDYSNIHTIIDVLTTWISGFPSPAGYGSFVVPGDQTTQFVTGYTFNVFGSVENSKTYTVASNSYLDTGNTVIPVDQSIISEIISGKLGLEVVVGNNTGSFTITDVLYDGGSIDSWPNISNPASYVYGNIDHTKITVVESLVDPMAVFTPPDQTYVAYVTLDVVVIEGMLSYSNIERDFDPGIPELLQTPDEGYLVRSIVAADSVLEEFTVTGDLTESNISSGQSFVVSDATLNNGTYTVLSLTYDSFNDQTTIAVNEDITDNTAYGQVLFDIGSNVFIVDGDLTSRFVQGEKFNVAGGSGFKVYTTLSSDFVDGKTRIRTIETIDTTGTGIIKEHYFGYDEHTELCTNVPETIVRVNFDERLVFDGLALELFDDIIAYNLENNDIWAYDLPISTIIDPVQPIIPLQPTAPLTPAVNDLWFDTSLSLFKRWNNYQWDKITKAYWYDTTNNLFFYRTINAFVDTGWVLTLSGAPGIDLIEPAVGETESIGSESFVSGDTGGGVPQTTFTLTSLTVPGTDPTLLSVKVNGIYASFTLNSNVEFTVTGPLVSIDDSIDVEIFDRTATETNAMVIPFNLEPQITFHAQIEPHATNDAYIVRGGNFIKRFIPSNEFEAFGLTGPVGSLGFWRATTFPIITVGAGTLTIDGEYQWLFQDGVVFTIRTAKNDYNDFIVQSTNSTGSGNTIITTTVAPTTEDHGVILGSVYDPTVNALDSTDQVKTIVATTAAIDMDVEGIAYEWIGPLRMDINLHPGTDISTTVSEILSASNELLSMAGRYEIVDTYEGTNTFRLHYDDPVSFLPVNLTDSFTPGTIFRVVDSYSDDNPSAAETNDFMWVVKTVYWDEGVTGDTVIEIEDDFNNIPPYNSFTVLNVTNTGGGSPGVNQITLQGDHVNLFTKWGATIFRLDQPVVNASSLLNVITIQTVELSAGDTILTVDETFIDEAFTGSIEIIDAVFMAEILFDETNVSLPWEHGSVVHVESVPATLTAATIVEDLGFGWGNTWTWPIVSTDQSSSKIVLDGDVTGIIDVGESGDIIGSQGNDNLYEVDSVNYLVGPNETEVIVKNPALAVDPPIGLLGSFQLEDIDVTNWFQYLIKEANATTNVFRVYGDATATVQNGQEFRVVGTPSNNGLYTVTTPPVFDGIFTEITVIDIVTTENGGWIESHRDYGIRIILSDLIGVSTSETADAGLLSTSGSLIDSWDYNYWNLGSWDESLGTVVHLYSNSF